MDDATRRKMNAVIAATCIAIPCEGLRQKAYLDPVGLPTICMGSTKGVKMGDFRTVPECQALLTKEMDDVIKHVESCRPGLPANVLAAFADASYNLGPKIACDTHASTAARRLAAGDYPGACRELGRWNRATVAGISVELPGLTKRRNLEQELCLASPS